MSVSRTNNHATCVADDMIPDKIVDTRRVVRILINFLCVLFNFVCILSSYKNSYYRVDRKIAEINRVIGPAHSVCIGIKMRVYIYLKLRVPQNCVYPARTTA